MLYVTDWRRNTEMRQYQIRITELAEEDLENAGDYIAYELKKRKASRIYAYSTYALFTNGLNEFDKAFQEGVISGILGSNLTYRTPELLSRPWFHEVDVSKYIAYFITALNHDIATSAIIDPHQKINRLLLERKASVS